MTNRLEEIEDLQDQIARIDGNTTSRNILNRIFGALGIGIGALSIHIGNQYDAPINIFPYIFGATTTIDSVGSLLTGKLHYILYRLTRVHPKYKLERVLQEVEQNDKRS